jgi:hypothetical protein
VKVTIKGKGQANRGSSDFFKKGEAIIGEIVSETATNYVVESADSSTQRSGVVYVYDVPKKSVRKA